MKNAMKSPISTVTAPQLVAIALMQNKAISEDSASITRLNSSLKKATENNRIKTSQTIKKTIFKRKMFMSLARLPPSATEFVQES